VEDSDVPVSQKVRLTPVMANGTVIMMIMGWTSDSNSDAMMMKMNSSASHTAKVCISWLSAKRRKERPISHE